METWWASLDLFQKIMWCIALPASVIFVIQMVMTFVGMDSDGGMDFDMDSGDAGGGSLEMPFQLFTFRNFINFFLGFSWSGISLFRSFESEFLLTLVSAFIGLLLVAVVMSIFYFLSRMVQSGNISITDTVGLTATVYIPIAEHRNCAGKIQISVHDAIREYDAITDGERLKTGEIVKVIEVVEGNLLLVEKV